MSAYNIIQRNNGDQTIGYQSELDKSLKDYTREELKVYKNNVSIARDVDIAIAQVPEHTLKKLTPFLDKMSKIVNDSRITYKQKCENWIIFNAGINQLLDSMPD